MCEPIRLIMMFNRATDCVHEDQNNNDPVENFVFDDSTYTKAESPFFDFE